MQRPASTAAVLLVIGTRRAASSPARHRCPVPDGLPAADYSQSRGDNRTQEMLAGLRDAPSQPVHGEATPGTLEGLRERVADAGYAYEETAIPGFRLNTGEGVLG